MALNFGWINGSDISEKARDRFAELIKEKAGMKVQDDYAKKFISYPIAEWAPKVEDVAAVLKQLLAELQEENG